MPAAAWVAAALAAVPLGARAASRTPAGPNTEIHRRALYAAPPIVRTAPDNESIHALPLLDTTIARGFAVETAALDKGYDVGPIYDGCEARDVRSDHPASPDHRSRSRRPQAADVRTRNVALRGVRLQARREQVALPDRRVQACLSLNQGEPPAPADPARNASLHGSLPPPRLGRARVRASQERLGARAAA